MSSPARHKILILNGSLDRETGPASDPFTAVDFIEAITRAGEESRGRHFLDPANGSATSPSTTTNPSHNAFPPLQLEINGLALSLPYTSYVTHVLHLDGPGTPSVDKDRLAEMGIECLRLYGRKIVSSLPDGSEVPVGMRYDSAGLTQALEMVLGKKGDAMLRGEGLSRRNTLDPGRKRGA
jgi:hypothetical protein